MSPRKAAPAAPVSNRPSRKSWEGSSLMDARALRSRRALPDNAGHRFLHGVFDDVREVVPQLVAVQIEIRKFTHGVFQCFLDDRRQGQLPNHRLYSFLERLGTFGCLFLFPGALANRIQTRPITIKYLNQGMYDIVIPHEHA